MIDQSVTDYIAALREKYYLDASVQKDGVNVLSEMVYFAKKVVELRRRQIEKQRDFMAKRLARISSIYTEIGTLSNNIGLIEKYDIFWKNAQDLAGESDYMDSMMSKVNFTVSISIRKIRQYRREYMELQYKIADLEDLLDFYESAETELSDLEAEL